MVGALLLATLQATPDTAGTLFGPERVSNRLDCESRSHAVPNHAAYPAYQTSYVFLFPIRPEHLSEEARRQVRFVRSMRDGRSWMVDARTEAVQWERWPRFAARIADGDGWISLESDPRQSGRVTLSGHHFTHHGPAFEESGECRFVPEIPTNEAPAR